jgi:carboxymethylenebutenolidase
MCFDFDARPPAPPADLLLAPIRGGAGPELLELTSADGTRFSAALAVAPEHRGAGIVIMPDVRGLYPFYAELAERFAQAGHDAIAIDYFGRTAGLGPRGEDFEYRPHVDQLQVPQVQADAQAALSALRERTAGASVVTVGFCLGGFHSFLAGADLGDRLSGVVGFYGILGPRFGVAGPLERVRDIKCPVLGLFGGADQAISVEQVEQFDADLGEAGVEHEIHVYPGAPHSFFDRRFEEHAEASEDAWRRMLAFLARHGAGARVLNPALPALA